MRITKITLLSLIFLGSISGIPRANSEEQSNRNNDLIQTLQSEAKVTNVYRAYYPNEILANKAAISSLKIRLSSSVPKYLSFETLSSI